MSDDEHRSKLTTTASPAMRTRRYSIRRYCCTPVRTCYTPRRSYHGDAILQRTGHQNLTSTKSRSHHPRRRGGDGGGEWVNKKAALATLVMGALASSRS